MKIKKQVDAERLKEEFKKLGDGRAIKVVEKEQGYKTFYAFVVRRRSGKAARTPVDEIPDDEFEAIVSVVARDEAEARKRIKEKMEQPHDFGAGSHTAFDWRFKSSPHYNWGMQTIKFVDEKTAVEKRFYEKYRNRWHSLVEL